MGILRYVEYYLARLLFNVKGKDAKLYTRDRLFSGIPKNITITSPTLGPSPAQLSIDHSQFGSSRFPELSWSIDPNMPGTKTSDVKEWFMIVEDPDAPIPIVPNHGMYYAIPATKTSVGSEDLQLDSAKTAPPSDGPEAKHLKGGFRLGKNLRGTLYSGPRPPVGHGEHRYFFQIVALKDQLDVKKMKPVATRDEVLRQMQGKICGWGEWIGTYENKW
ncbi:hypothetical protein PV04_00540 [Phialophora macrospora]|uniref:YbhB/YbcL family Raf kinase inhibitor-like protein n=1 Tax=Phialophora macrospora TaxID=1851006 RepID=A0A0D2D451_9EURO|nr:hypothetical protein PV04_00540 [Phialophora macrospora]